jgi:hypothetical protein
MDRYAPAIVLIAVGTIFFLNNLHIVRVWELWIYWPVILIVGGIFKLVDSATDQGRIGGGISLVIGAIFLADNLGLLPVRVWDLWPLLLIGLGVLLLVNRFPAAGGVPDPPRRSLGAGAKAEYRRGGYSSSTMHDFALFGGGKRKITSDCFESAHFDAVFGGFEIDLRNALIAGDSAVVEVNAVFGGAEIRIPESWSAAVRGVGIFGGYSDSTTQPNPSVFPNPKILVVKGTAIFGGVNVKN